jgi:radical SAM superfamily enzyme YgiQ (UPF0313 family)
MRDLVLLAYPKPTEESPTTLTPLSVLFPAAMYEAQGRTVVVWDERFDPYEEFDALVKDASQVGVSAFTGTQAGRAARLLKRAKALKPGVHTIVGGHHARILPDQVAAEPFVDEVAAKPPYGEELFPWGPQYERHWRRSDVQFFTSRGCPYACSFCALRSDWEPRPVEQLDREINTMHEALGFKEITFSDPNIATGVWREGDGMKRIDRVERIRQIGGVLRPLGVRWISALRSPYLTEQMVDALAWAGCAQLEIGCESGDDEFLRRVIRKGHGVDAIKAAARRIKGSGISLLYSFIMGMPRETPAMRAATADLIDWIAAEDPLARVSVYQFTPYPGSPMYDEAVAGVDGFTPFVPPTTMEGWGALRLMRSPAYWITGLTFRGDNTRKNFPGAEWAKIEPYVTLAQRRWRERNFEDFPQAEAETLISAAVAKRHLQMGAHAEGYL